jgi:hypothetical protein
MPKLKCQIKSKVEMSKLFWISNLGIHLTFACLLVGRDFEIWIQELRMCTIGSMRQEERRL